MKIRTVQKKKAKNKLFLQQLHRKRKYCIHNDNKINKVKLSENKSNKRISQPADEKHLSIRQHEKPNPAAFIKQIISITIGLLKLKEK